MNSWPATNDLSALRAGDIVAFSGAAFHSDLINLLTYGWPRWSASHVAIIGNYKGTLLLWESTTRAPDKCIIQNAFVQGTQAQLPGLRIAHYRGRVWHYPLSKSLSLRDQYRLSCFLKQNIGKPYDAGGSLLAGARLWADMQAFFHQENIAALFCSEWVAAAHRHINLFKTTNVGKWSPNALIREERKRGILGPPRRLK